MPAVQDENRVAEQDAADRVAVDGDVTEEVLVEEVSIDGMCGVY
ncbi:mycofactocin precursor MftA [Streptomyces sp. NPDC052012]